MEEKEGEEEVEEEDEKAKSGKILHNDKYF